MASKRPKTAPKPTTEMRLAFDIREYFRLTGGHVLSRVLYRWKSPRLNMPVASSVTLISPLLVEIKHTNGDLPNEVLDVVYTPCRFGGRRPWIMCSRLGCCRRAAIVYDTPKGFRCRHCCGLDYQSHRERPWDRMLRKARTVRRKAGGCNNLLEAFPARPKGMHETTYLRLREQEASCWGPIGEHALKRVGKRVAKARSPNDAITLPYG